MTAAKAAARQPVKKPASNLSIVSLVAGILGLTLVPVVGSIVAIVTAVAARNEIRAGDGPLQGEGLALAGLILGIAGVVIPLVAFCLIGTLVLFPACLGALFTISEFQSASSFPPILFTVTLAI